MQNEMYRLLRLLDEFRGMPRNSILRMCMAQCVLALKRLEQFESFSFSTRHLFCVDDMYTIELRVEI